jgi:hypothetical protein
MILNALKGKDFTGQNIYAGKCPAERKAVDVTVSSNLIITEHMLRNRIKT